MTRLSPAELRRMRREAVRDALLAAPAPVTVRALAECLNLPRIAVEDTLQELQKSAPPPPAFPAGPLCVDGGWLWIA